MTRTQSDLAKKKNNMYNLNVLRVRMRYFIVKKKIIFEHFFFALRPIFFNNTLASKYYRRSKSIVFVVTVKHFICIFYFFYTLSGAFGFTMMFIFLFFYKHVFYWKISSDVCARRMITGIKFCLVVSFSYYFYDIHLCFFVWQRKTTEKWQKHNFIRVDYRITEAITKKYDQLQFRSEFVVAYERELNSPPNFPPLTVTRDTVHNIYAFFFFFFQFVNVKKIENKNV